MARLTLNEKAARALLRAKDRWFKHGTTHYYARDKNNDSTEHDSKDAVCWCALGALMREAKEPTDGPCGELYVKARKALQAAVGGGSIVDWNDDGDLRRTHWNKAAAALRKQDKEAKSG